jgi:hypothetical protein
VATGAGVGVEETSRTDALLAGIAAVLRLLAHPVPTRVIKAAPQTIDASFRCTTRLLADGDARRARFSRPLDTKPASIAVLLDLSDASQPQLQQIRKFFLQSRRDAAHAPYSTII